MKTHGLRGVSKDLGCPHPPPPEVGPAWRQSPCRYVLVSAPVLRPEPAAAPPPLSSGIIPAEKVCGLGSVSPAAGCSTSRPSVASECVWGGSGGIGGARAAAAATGPGGEAHESVYEQGRGQCSPLQQKLHTLYNYD